MNSINPLHLFFHWPDGGVWSNIVASAIWAAPSFAWLDRLHKKRHQERMLQAERHFQHLKKRIK